MIDTIKPTEITFGGPANYRITVQGVLSPDWSGRLASMTISSGVMEPDRKPKAVLQGMLRDQSELSLVLDTLYQLHLPIIKVEQLN